MNLRTIAIATVLGATLVGFSGCAESDGPTRNEMRLGEEIANLEDQLADVGQARDDAYNEVDDLEEEVERLEAELHDANAPFETTEDDGYLDETEWQQGLVAARQLLGNETIAPGWIGNFVEAVSQEEGVYWSPIEQREFRIRYRNWYRENYGQ